MCQLLPKKDQTYVSSIISLCTLVTKSKSYEQLLIDNSLCSKRIEPEAIAHCAFKLTQDIATTPHMPPINVF